MKLPEELASLLSDPETPNGVLQDLLQEMEGRVDVARVYIVLYCQGKWSDYTEEPHAAFLDEEAAIAYINKHNNDLLDKGKHRTQGNGYGPDYIYTDVVLKG